MNEIKLSTQIYNDRTSRISLKFNLSKLGVDWKLGDMIRVISSKDKNTFTLKKVNVKSSKTITYKLTKSCGGLSTHCVGLNILYGNRRFKGEFTKAQSINVACRTIAANKIEIYIPNEIYQ